MSERNPPPRKCSGLFRALRILLITLFGTLFLCLAILAIGIGSVAAYYYHIVGQRPGALAVSVKPGELGRWVDPFIGTGGIPWLSPYNSPAATVPYGWVRLAPDTASILTGEVGLNASGYYYGDNKVIGFSHTRLLGADALEGGHFRVFPTRASRLSQDYQDERVARFSHREETGFPGYYAVHLDDPETLAELTATPHVGVHRYTFLRAKDVPHLLLDVSSVLGNARTEAGKVTILPASQEVEGSIRTFGSFASRYGGLDVFFVARFSKPFLNTGTWIGKDLVLDRNEAEGEKVGADLSFGEEADGTVVEVRLALSAVSIANARENLEAEAAGSTFEELAEAAGSSWEKKLSPIRIAGGTDRQKRIFYTALYRSFQMPSVFSDVNGQYRGFDKEVHQAEGFRYFTDFSLWDTFRTVQPLFYLIARDDSLEMMKSLLAMATTGGAFPRWPAGCGYTNCMMGTPADCAVSEAYLKGIRGFDIESAYKILRQIALEGKPDWTKFAGRSHLEDYLDLGYCPSEKMSKAVSQTLEFAGEDHALSLLAKELGYVEDASRFARNSQSYRNLWNPETQYFHPKDSQGNFSEIDPLLLSYLDREGKLTEDYCEGSALQWRWAVPFDPDGLVSLFESPEYFVQELNAFFEQTTEVLGRWNPGPYYWHGNEPDIHAAYLFNHAGRPDLTQKWVRWILDHKYSDDYVGLDGNDDGGTLSAWYVWSALGLYPIAGTTIYELGAPLFESASIDLGEATLEIAAANFSPESLYVEKVTLNETALDRTWITHEEISEGGKLVFLMRPDPPQSAIKETVAR